MLPNFITLVVLLITFICCHQQFVNSFLLLVLLSLKYYKLQTTEFRKGAEPLKKGSLGHQILSWASCSIVRNLLTLYHEDFHGLPTLANMGPQGGCWGLILQPMLAAKAPCLGLYLHASISEGLTPFSTLTPTSTPVPLSRGCLPGHFPRPGPFLRLWQVTIILKNNSSACGIFLLIIKNKAFLCQ